MSDDAVAAQVRAADPAASSWVSANAGSGKTRVLTDRVARLLLAGTEPQKILCLTYTKAAAAEMQNRLFRTLGAWAMLDDAALARGARAARRARRRDPADRLARARTLFARALETPGGLRIQTIHAFCEALLRRFPLEAGVAPQFGVLDDRQAKALREEVLDALADDDPRELRRRSPASSPATTPTRSSSRSPSTAPPSPPPSTPTPSPRRSAPSPSLTADGARRRASCRPRPRRCSARWSPVLAAERPDRRQGRRRPRRGARRRRPRHPPRAASRPRCSTAPGAGALRRQGRQVPDQGRPRTPHPALMPRRSTR